MAEKVGMCRGRREINLYRKGLKHSEFRRIKGLSLGRERLLGRDEQCKVGSIRLPKLPSKQHHYVDSTLVALRER
jgi:hypothetical protein